MTKQKETNNMRTIKKEQLKKRNRDTTKNYEDQPKFIVNDHSRTLTTMLNSQVNLTLMFISQMKKSFTVGINRMKKLASSNGAIAYDWHVNDNNKTESVTNKQILKLIQQPSRQFSIVHACGQVYVAN